MKTSKLADIGTVKSRRAKEKERVTLVTGGAGFIGSNLAHALASAGRRVRLLGNLSRPGVERNLRWLQATHGDRISFEKGDVRDAAVVQRAVADVETVFHFAAQVAVTTYGCSKGTADQLVLDYARSYGLRTAVFRMSCIYGPHQFGTEDQGWVAHFLIRILEDQPITLYGDGMQVRDILFVEDLVQAFLHAERHIGEIAGQAFNMGGGPANTISLLELIDLIGQIHGQKPVVTFESWRTGDQRWYVSNTFKLAAITGWRQRVNVREGVSRLYTWLQESREVADLREGPRVAVGRHAS